MDWDTRLKSLTDKKFQRRYRIDKEGFDILLADIKQYLPRVRRGGVCNELKLAMTLRWLAGGSYLDIAGAQAPLPVRSQSVYTRCVSQGIHADLHGVSEDTMYRHVWKIIRAIDRKFKLPLINQLNNVHLPSSGTDRSDVETVAQGFDEKTHGVMSGCIGAVDGIAIKLDARTLADVDSKAAHWCRKGFYSLNYQVVADSNRRITWASAKFCGSTHDSVALDQTEFRFEKTKGGKGKEPTYKAGRKVRVVAVGAAKPAAKLAAKPAAKLAAKPAAKLAAKPAAGPAAKPDAALPEAKVVRGDGVRGDRVRERKSLTPALSPPSVF